MSTPTVEQAEADEADQQVHDFAITVGRARSSEQCSTVSCDQRAAWVVAVDGVVQRGACDRHAPSAVASGAAAAFTGRTSQSRQC